MIHPAPEDLLCLLLYTFSEIAIEKMKLQWYAYLILKILIRNGYEASKKQLTKHMAKFGESFSDCVVEEWHKIWSCKPVAISFMTPDLTCHTED